MVLGADKFLLGPNAYSKIMHKGPLGKKIGWVLVPNKNLWENVGWGSGPKKSCWVPAPIPK